MEITKIAIAFLFILFYNQCFTQEKNDPITINKKVEVVDYAYQYVIVEFISSLSSSVYYPLLTSANITDKQLYFEQGRNIRLGSQVGFTQTLKADSWAVSSGISMQTYNELFAYHDYTLDNVVIESQDGSLQTITIATGEPIPYTKNNTLTYLQIPLILRYYPEMFHEKMALNLGINYNVLVNANYMAKYSTVQHAFDVAYSEFNRSYLSFIGSLIFSVISHKNFSLNIEPYYCLGLSRLIDQTDLSFGLNSVGLRTYLSLNY